MAYMAQYPCFSSLESIKAVSLTNTRIIALKVSSSSEPDGNDPVKLALAKANAYKKSKKITQTPLPESSQIAKKNDGSVSEVTNNGNEERERDYRENEGVVGSSNSVERVEMIPGFKDGNDLVEKSTKKGKPTVSSMDFVGLGFADKKQSRGLPPGLVPTTDPYPEGALPEVEIIVGDTSNFGDAAASKPKTTVGEDSELYKPKVSTWGVFPRPGNISKTFGGGKVIRPGEVLETAEDKAAKEARTRQFIAAYKRKMGLSIDPKLRAECEKALKDGDSLMDLGKLKEALPFYEKVMNKLAFQSELHGLAALQWSICLDSLNRPNEARVMYEKLQTHPNVRVSKKARQFVFGFQAMEMMKITSSTMFPTKTGYQNFFEAFIENKANYPLKEIEVDEGALSQALPYAIFLASPLFIILVLAIQKGL